MKLDIINFLRHCADELRDKRRDDLAFSTLHFANNLRLLMRGEVSIDDWNKVYVGADREPFDAEAIVPIRRFENEDEKEA